ncbi:hypothetical protein CPB86DRAFT_707299 [Serendipita vermifera]|nr:hypothetical protein CPB86DRAFT_707299 [Serendipita vermifera]
MASPYKNINSPLLSLPIELLYDIHLWALNPELPGTCKTIYKALKGAPTSISARYLFYRYMGTSLDFVGIITNALRYPLCTLQVFERFLSIMPPAYKHLYPKPTQTPDGKIIKETPTRLFKIPRRLLRGIVDGNTDSKQECRRFLDLLYSLPPVTHPGTTKPQAIKPDSNSHDGYPLIKAVQARDKDIIRFLLAHKADPSRRDKKAVLMAISYRDLDLVKLLVEGLQQGVVAKMEEITHPRTKSKNKVAPITGDLVAVDNIMLGAAVRNGATEIVEWLVKEKGCVPDIKTLRSLE